MASRKNAGIIAGPHDPFWELMRPPPDETPAQATARRTRELESLRQNDLINEQIKQDRALIRKEKGVVKVLLLGQSESGKSTTLKNFRMRFATSDWDKERHSWRAVIQLNIVRSITTILHIVESELNGEPHVESDEEPVIITSGLPSPTAATHGLKFSDDRQNADAASSEADIIGSKDITSEEDYTIRQGYYSADEPLCFTDRHRMLLIRLTPLIMIENELKRRLRGGEDPPAPIPVPMSATPFEEPHLVPLPRRKKRRMQEEFAVRSWKDVVDPGIRKMVGEGNASSEPDAATLTIAERREDMKTLWEDPTVKLALEKRKVQLPDSAGFFLNDLDRIAIRDYKVTDDDIVRARLRTVGIQEFRLTFVPGPTEGMKKKESTWEWRIYDVGGCRTLRSAWVPYFDNANVIIFLSPVSVFDQRLEEDTRVNRLEDSLVLWTSICSSKLLSRTQLILFLNKCDLLRRKLKHGVQVKDHLPSYGDRPNDTMSVVKYFREKFKDIQKECSSHRRSVYIYATTVTDTAATGVTLESVRDGVLRENLAKSQLI